MQVGNDNNVEEGETEVDNNLEANVKSEEELKKPKLCCSARLLLTIMGFLAIFNVSYVRVGISMAMVCMVSPQTESREPEHADSRIGEFDWSSSMKGYLTSAAFYGFIAGPSVAGFLSFKYGGKIILVIGTILAGVSNILLPEATRMTSILFFVLRISTGFFTSFTFPAFYDVAAHWIVPEERQLLIGGAMVGIPTASILNFPVTTLVCEQCGWVWIFYIFGMWMMLCSVGYFFIIYDYPEKCSFISIAELSFLKKRIPNPGKLKIPWKKIVMSMPVYAYVVMHFSMNYVYLSMILSLPLLMEDVYHLNFKENGMLSATPFMGSFVTRILLSLFFEQLRIKLKLSKNAMRKILISIGATFVSIFFVIITFLSCAYRYWVVGCFVMASCALELCITGGYLLSLLDLCPSYVNVVTGLANSIGNTAGLICPVVNGWITLHGTKDEWSIVFYVNITILLSSSTFYLVFGRNHLQYWGLASLPTQPALPRSSLVT